MLLMLRDDIRGLGDSVSRALGSWWQDERRNWCAYCGIPMRKRAAKGEPLPPTKATRDHVIPKAHKGGRVTIPACRECNAAKGTMSLPEFLGSEHFRLRRTRKHRHQWSIHSLWAVSGLAALKCAEASYVAAIGQPAEKRDARADHTR